MLEGRIPDSLREQLEGGVSEVAVVNSKGHKFGFQRFRRCQWRFEVVFDGGCGRMDIGVSAELVGRDGEMVPRAAAIYSIARLSRLFCEISKNCNVAALEG